LSQEFARGKKKVAVRKGLETAASALQDRQTHDRANRIVVKDTAESRIVEKRKSSSKQGETRHIEGRVMNLSGPGQRQIRDRKKQRTQQRPIRQEERLAKLSKWWVRFAIIWIISSITRLGSVTTGPKEYGGR